jgi:hypothetical protein
MEKTVWFSTMIFEAGRGERDRFYREKHIFVTILNYFII